jgi:cryptochrome
MASTVWWLRKGLRLHDNPALLAALEGATAVHPLFVLDPVFLKPAKVGAPRLRFLLESLADLDVQLRARNSRLIVLHGTQGVGARRLRTALTPARCAGSPAEVLPEALRAWGATRLCFEWDSEEYALARDAQATRDAQALGCTVVSPVSNTLYDPRAVIAAYGGRPPLTYTVRPAVASRHVLRCVGNPRLRRRHHRLLCRRSAR